MDNNIFLNHRGKKVYKERNLLLLSKGDKIRIEADVIVEQYSTMPVKSFSSVGAFSFPTCQLPGNVRIGRFCSIASNVKIMGGNHPMNRFTTHMLTYNGEFDKYAASEFGQNWTLKPFITKPKDLTIGNDVWIGNDVVLKGGFQLAMALLLLQILWLLKMCLHMLLSQGFQQKLSNTDLSQVLSKSC